MQQPSILDHRLMNLGGIRPWELEKTEKSYTLYLEQQMTSDIKSLYYLINERPKGIIKDQVNPTRLFITD